MQPTTSSGSSQYLSAESARLRSPNHEARRGAYAQGPDLVVLHYTGMASADAAAARLCDPASGVSAHYLIDARGVVAALVDEGRRAWHAGASSWRGEADVNSRSIGIELANDGHGADGRAASPPFPEPQMAALERLLAELRARHKLAAEAVVGHSDVAPGRKIDPGERFDWRRLSRRGLAADWPSSRDATPISDAAFRAAAAAYGYGDWPTAALLDAVRRRFRPQALGRDGAPQAADAAVLARGGAVFLSYS